MSAKARRRVLRLSLDGDWKGRWVEDEVAVDVPVEVYVGKELFRTFLASPGLERELAVGHLLAEGIIDSVDEVERVRSRDHKVYVSLKTDRQVRLEASKVNHLVMTSCGSTSDLINLLDRLRPPKVGAKVSLRPEVVLGMVRELNRRGEVFRATGGTHSAMLCDVEGEVLAYAEDVGRHNAVDKVIGVLALSGGDFSRCVLVSSGRQSSYMVLKAARVGIPVVISQAGPLESGIRVAEESGVTLICFARGRRMNIYTHPKRVFRDLGT